MNELFDDADTVALGPFGTEDITRGVCRHLRKHRFSPLTEFKLTNRRRVDVVGLDKGGRFVVVEVKSSVRDFQADSKWPEYLPFCDRFYFAVANGFPTELIPETSGVMIADRYDAAIIREPVRQKMNATRRRNQILRFAQASANRLHRINDPTI